MGRRGPPPTDRTVLEMRGTFRPDRHGGDEPSVAPPVAKVPKAPSHLSDLAKKLWRQKAKLLIALERLTDADLAALEGYCVAHARAIDAEDVVSREGRTIATLEGCKRHPELVTAERARAEMRRYEMDFGLTPSARARMRAPAEKKKPADNPFSAVARTAARKGA